MKTINLINKVYNMVDKAQTYKLNIWFKDVLFTWYWWFGVLLTIVPWVLLFVLNRFNKNIYNNLFTMFFIIIISTNLDTIGVQTGLWHYYYEVLPLNPAYIPWDFSLVPFTIVFFINLRSIVNPYLKSILFAFLSAFIAGPFFQWIDLYKNIHWHELYSFIAYILLYLISHYFHSKITLYIKNISTVACKR